VLAPLRDDLRLYTGAPDRDGWPTWLIHDPARALYLQIGWPLFEILRRWHLRDPSLIRERINAETTLDLSEDDLRDAVTFLWGNELLQARSEADTRSLAQRAAARERSLSSRLLHDYLFFRLPLVRPDKFLSATLPAVRFFGQRAFLVATMCALVLGLILVARQWNTFSAQFAASLTFEGLIGYAAAVAIAKCVHELSHGYVAKAHGCRVSTMGLAFLVLYPVPYTDTNDAWKVRAKRGRLAIASAGMFAELYLAAWSTLLWSFLPEGSAKSAVFTLAVTTWTMSLVVNLSPIMRFDGYYVLSDLWEMPNLHARAFALARWNLREVLFGLKDPPPEQHAARHRGLLIAFAYIVWAYRLVVFLAIALLVYHFFIKIVGVILFAVEIIWFVVRPIAQEASVWWSRRMKIVRNRSSAVTAGALALLVATLIIPWQTAVDSPAVLRAERKSPVLTPLAAEVRTVFISEGSSVKAGDPLLELRSASLDHRLAENEVRRLRTEREIRTASVDEEYRGHLQYLREALASAEAEKNGLLEERSKLRLVAPFDGRIVYVLSDMGSNQTLPAKQRVALLIDPAKLVAHAFVTEEQIHRFDVGAMALFIPAGASQPSVRMRVTEIERTTIQTLDYDVLGSKFGGPIATYNAGNQQTPRQATYRITAAPAQPGPEAEVELTGVLQIVCDPESLLARAFRSAVAVIVRESGM
jgi:putative peptide zinc metalloprotease protein